MAGSQGTVTFAEPVLHAPGEVFDFLALSRLPAGEFLADFGGAPIVLGAFHHHPACVGVSAFGDGALPAFAAGGVFAGDEAEVGHQFAGMLEATQVTEFADNGHGRDLLEAFAGHESEDDGFPLPFLEDLFHPFLNTCGALHAVVDGLNVFFKNKALGGIGHGELAQVAHMGIGPLCFLGIGDSSPQEKGVELLFAGGKSVGGVGACAAKVSDGFIKSRRNTNGGDVTVAE